MGVNNLTFQQSIVANETPALGLALVADPTITHKLSGSGLDSQLALSPTTTPPVSKVASGQRTLTAGALTEDLTSLAGPSSSTVTFTGLKLVFIEIACPAANTQNVTFTVGASNGLNFLGVAASKISIPPGGSFSAYMSTGGTTVDGTHKTIDVTSAMAAAVYNIVMGAG